MDFVPDSERDAKREELRRNIASLFGTLFEFGKKIEDIERVKAKTVEKLTKAGYTDVEEVFNEVFTKWKIKKEDKDV